jgi:hypothetical protein
MAESQHKTRDTVWVFYYGYWRPADVIRTDVTVLIEGHTRGGVAITKRYPMDAEFVRPRDPAKHGTDKPHDE